MGHLLWALSVPADRFYVKIRILLWSEEGSNVSKKYYSLKNIIHYSFISETLTIYLNLLTQECT